MKGCNIINLERFIADLVVSGPESMFMELSI